MKRLANYSQNFLRSPKLVESLVGLSNLKKDDIVLDIGAGSGVISSVLAKNVKKVIAIEYEPKIAEKLKQNMHKLKNVEVIVGDIQKLKLPNTSYKVFANIPFHLSSAIIKKFINSPNSPEAAYLIVQRQFGKKLTSNRVGDFTSQLGMTLGTEYSVKIIKNLKKTDFWPHPAVDTVFIEIIKRKQSLVEHSRLSAYEKFTKECFEDPKKLSKMPLHVIGQSAGVSPSRLSIDQWIILFNSQKYY